MRTTLAAATATTIVLALYAAPALAVPTPGDGPAPMSVSDQNVQGVVSARDQAINAARTATGRGVADPALTSAFARASGLASS